MARKTLRQKLEENGKLESAMSYADIRTPDNSLKERVASRANSIMNNSENKISSFAPIIRTGNTVSQKNTMDVIKYKREEKTQKEQKEKQERIDKFKQMNVEQAKKANETMKNGNILEKTGVLAGNIGRGIVSGASEGFGDILASAYNIPTLIGNTLGVETAQQKNGKMIDGKDFVNDWKEIKNIENEYGRNLDGVINSGSYRLSKVAGNMIPAMTSGSLADGLGLSTEAVEGIRKVTSALSSGTSTYLDTLDEKQTNGVKSALKGALYGYATHKIEGITGGNFISKTGSLDDLAIKGISNFKSEFGKKIASKVYEATGEAIEENVENMADHLIDCVFGDAEEMSLKDLLKEAGQTTADTMALNFIMQAIGLGGGTYNDVKMYEANQKIDNANIRDRKSVV